MNVDFSYESILFSHTFQKEIEASAQDTQFFAQEIP